MKLAIIGDFNKDFRPHVATNEAIRHSIEKYEITLQYDWITTDTIEKDFTEIVSEYNGFWIAPGSPYKSMTGALKVIKYARENGILKTYDDFAKILTYVGDNLGKEALEDLHVHISGINYGLKGEKNHLPFLESDFNYKACMEAFKKFDVKGCIICESPILENDSLLIKKYYESL